MEAVEAVDKRDGRLHGGSDTRLRLCNRWGGWSIIHVDGRRIIIIMDNCFDEEKE